MDKKKIAVPLVCHGHSRPVVDLFYSPVTPDGFFLISASKDSSPMLRNGETGDWIGTFEGHKGAVWSVCLDTNALRAASASADFFCVFRFLAIYADYAFNTSVLEHCKRKVWDALTGDVLHSFEHKHIVRACAFSEDTHLLLTGGVEKVLRIYDLNRPDAPPREVDKSPGSVRTVTWMHSDQTILSSCTDMGGVRLWDVRSGKIVQTLETKSSVTSAEVSQDGRYITTADGSTVKFWDANHYGLVKSYNMPCTVESASLEPKYGNKFVAGGEDMWVRVFDFHTGDEIGCLGSRQIFFVMSISLPYPISVVGVRLKYKQGSYGDDEVDAHGKGTIAGVICYPCFISTYKNDFMRPEAQVYNAIHCNKGHHGPVHCVRFSPGGESYASGSEDGTIRIWLTGPLTHDGTEPFAANGSVGKVKVTAEDVSRKIEGFQIAEEGKTKEKETGKE
ncbi:hypothetical protein GOBAR_AA18822 [Gossypium barbadense]|uniref:Serine-threonine kinase receptor-associated protein n=1 Tax=Gossypium barbadense TaxID=3634 RepID=A0A2P5XEU0_GOSBA|nr:hypothetical protein GOBAR_AA18822 [Gossypium barbadense]